MESPQVARRKVALISRADQLNLNAANALLKTLEEPPADTFLILLHRAGQPLLPTIRSRCQALRVEAPDTETGVAWLGDQCPNSSAADRLTALQWAGGAPLEAKAASGGGAHWSAARVSAGAAAVSQSGKLALRGGAAVPEDAVFRGSGSAPGLGARPCQSSRVSGRGSG